MFPKTFPTKLLLIILFVLQLYCPAFTRAETVNRIVAVVNDDIITLKDLQEEGAMIFQKIRREAPPAQVGQAMHAARKEMLSTLIDKKIIEQRAAKLGFSVSDQELEDNLNQMIASRGLTKESFRQEMIKRGDTVEHYRTMLRTQLLQSKLVNFDVRSKVVITDDKVRDYYENQFASSKTESGYHLQQIGVKWGTGKPDLKKEDARELIENLRVKAIKGAKFEELAKENSELPSAADGGDIGIFTKDEMAPYMREAISNTEAGKISPVVETPKTFQFFKLVASKEGGVVSRAPFDTVKEDIRQKLYQEELQQNFNNWVKQLREQADIKEYL